MLVAKLNCHIYTHHNPIHTVAKQARIPVSTPPMKEPPTAADTLQLAVHLSTDAATDFRLRQAFTVADVSLTGHWVIKLND